MISIEERARKICKYLFGSWKRIAPSDLEFIAAELLALRAEALEQAAAWLKTPIPSEERKLYTDYEGRLLSRAADRMLKDLL